jgi:ABC-type branched-subunit amino acid transport system ATPase component
MCQELSFGYPNCKELYRGVEFGIDLGSRVALVGPNGAGKVCSMTPPHLFSLPVSLFGSGPKNRY